MAGYPDPMVVFIAQNPGLASRFKTVIEFADYTDDEIVGILHLLAENSDYTVTADAEAHFREILADTPRTSAFGNGRFARNALEVAIGRHAWRLRDVTDPTAQELRELLVEDFRDPDAPAPTAHQPLPGDHPEAPHETRDATRDDARDDTRDETRHETQE